MRASKLISTATGCALLESIGSTALRSMLCKTLVTPRFELLCRSQSTTGRGTSTKHSAESKLNLEAYLQLSNNTLPRRSSRRESFLQQNRTERKRITQPVGHQHQLSHLTSMRLVVNPASLGPMPLHISESCHVATRHSNRRRRL